LPAALGHILKQENARKKLRPAGNLDQRRTGSAEISGHIANIRKCWAEAVNRIMAQRMLVKIHARLMRSNSKVRLEGKMRCLASAEHF